MTAESPPAPPRSALSGVTVAGRLLVAVAVGVLVAHGCHGPDEDHEPSAPPPAHRDRE